MQQRHRNQELNTTLPEAYSSVHLYRRLTHQNHKHQGDRMLYRLLFTALLIANFGLVYSQSSKTPFFQASQKQPYHLSVGAVLFDQNGHIACHFFKEILGHKDVYILMRESVENEENLLNTLHRGLMEEFGATASPVAFLGSLSGYLPDPKLPFEKTTLYVVCQVIEWDPAMRDMNDPEAGSIIDWLEPNELIKLMQKQGEKFKRVDANESEMIVRALPYIQEALQKNNSNQKS